MLCGLIGKMIEFIMYDEGTQVKCFIPDECADMRICDIAALGLILMEVQNEPEDK